MFNILSMNDSLFFDAIRGICSVLDKAVYWIISLVYEIILEVANIDVFNGQAGEFSERLYTLIGIFMLFRVSFSIITYIINPDATFDKEKGGAKLVKNIVITFILIIIMPNIFSYMSRIQNAVLEEHLIENFILGTGEQTSSYRFQMSEECGEKTAVVKNAGNYIALTVFRPFYQIDPNGNDPQSLIAGSDYCIASHVGQLLASDIYNSPNSISAGSSVMGNYNVDYWFIISTLVGGAVAVILIGFAMDVAVRSIKLAFLQIISPIPIISYIDPNQAKSGMFKKWAKEVGKTWADLFIKLIALYFVVKILTMLDGVLISISEVQHKFWVSILIVVGGLIFAKKLPTLIGNMLGIKLDGGFTINPLKKFEKEALGGKLPGKLATAVGGGATSAIGSRIGYNRAKNKFKNDIDEQDKKYNEFKAKQAEKLSEAQTLAERQEIINETVREGIKLKKEVDEKKAKLEEDYYGKFSNVHPIAAGIMETLRGTKLGFSKDVKKPTDIIANSIEAAKMSAKEKNQHDIFSISRRFDDFITDIAGVKNDSGTTSLYKKEIKQIDESLKDIANMIEQKNLVISNLLQKAPQGFKLDRNEKGELEYQTIAGFNYKAALGLEKDQVEQIIYELKTLREEEKLRNKRKNELNEAMKMDKGK